LLICQFFGNLQNVSAEDDPTIRNKKLSEWLKVLHNDPDPKQRQLALLIAIDVVGPKNANVLPAVLRELKDNSDAGVRSRCAERLTRFAGTPEKIVDPLITSLTTDKEGKVREAAATSLGKLERNAFPAVAALTGALKDSDVATRGAAGWSLGQLSGLDAEIAKSALPALVECLKDSESQVRTNAAYALGRIGPQAAEASRVLGELAAGDKSAVVRKEACKTLAAIGPKAAPAVGALTRALHDPQADLRQQAAIALGKIGPDAVAALTDLLKAAREPDKSVRCHAIHAIGSMGKSAATAIPELIRILKEDDVIEVKVAAIEELGGFGPDAAAAVEPLTVAAKDGRIAIREAAAEALKKIQKMP
jgi:HEAT repeat protein